MARKKKDTRPLSAILREELGARGPGRGGPRKLDPIRSRRIGGKTYGLWSTHGTKALAQKETRTSRIKRNSVSRRVVPVKVAGKRRWAVYVR